MLAVYITDGYVYCNVYDNTDGLQCTDILSFPVNLYNRFTISSVTVDSHNMLMLQHAGNTIFYTIKDDFFIPVYNADYTSKINLLSYANGKFTAYFSKLNLYNFLNGLKRKRIEQYSFLNCINTVSDTERQKILSLFTACADIMDFDSENFDYDTFMKYILCTNKNFEILTDIPSEYVADSGGLSIVSAKYIDYILYEVFDIIPQHPAVNALINRGFCFDNGYYYYKNIFNTFYATDVIGIEGIYRLGNGILYVVFTDIYRQGDISFPEYSYGVIHQEEDGSYRLLKLGMGRNLLSERELIDMTPYHERSEYVWNSSVKIHEDNIILIILLLLCVSLGIVSIVCGAALVLREYRKQ